MKTVNVLSRRRIQIAVLSVIALAGMVLISPRAGAEDPATQPATTQPAAQTVQTISADLDKQYSAIQESLSTPDTLTDPAKRAAAAPKVMPGLKKMVADLATLASVDPDHKQEALDGKAEFMMFLSLFGDADATKALASESASADKDAAVEGQRSQLMVSWINSASDSKAQTDLADQIEKLAKDNNTSTGITLQLMRMSQLGCSSKDLSTRLKNIVTGTMNNAVADGMKQQMQAGAKLAALENKPLIIAGNQPDSKPFTTADWKGKVILVDFWATWCGPCREELPRVAKLYSDYHAKGLEVLGVSNDFSADDLAKFLGEHKEMPWTQLLDADAAKNQQWNPITLGYGINGIPTMFLIDKKGVCRTVEARGNMEEMIPKLLDEK